MKKTIALSLVLAASMSLAACSTKADDAAANAADTMAAEAVEGAENAAAAARALSMLLRTLRRSKPV